MRPDNFASNPPSGLFCARRMKPLLATVVLELPAARTFDRRCGNPIRRWLSAGMVGLMGWTTLHAAEFVQGEYHAYPGDDLQAVINQAATNATSKRVVIHEGTYRPKAFGQALIYLNRRHDGVQLRGLGRPILSAANPEIAPRSNPSFPAVVNHVLYLGDGLSSNTVIENFRITGANHFVTNSLPDLVEPDWTFRKGRFYFGDGGAIKIYHRSSPHLRDLEIVENYASPCAGGISIQHEGATNQQVLIENCVFHNNRAEVTGAALDLLWGSHARVINCLFTGNISNTGPGEGENPFNNNGAITVFPRSRLQLDHCTLTRNRNGVDDQGGLSTFSNSIFSSNILAGGNPGLTRYELDLPRGGQVQNCVIDGSFTDPRGGVGATNNWVNPERFQLSPEFVPVTPAFQGVGYRPAWPR